MTQRPESPDHPRDDVAALIRAAGKRPAVPEDAMRRAKAAARAEWQHEVRNERPRRSIGWVAALAAAAALVAMIVTGRLLVPETPDAQAEGPLRVEQLEGTAEQLDLAARVASNPVPVSTGDRLDRGAELRTGAEGRLALRTPSGHSIRLDRETRILIPLDGPLQLVRGAIYVDSGASESTGAGLLIQAPQGLVEEIGTQFEIRVVGEALRVRLREGAVVVHAEHGSHDVRAGNELTLESDGETRQSAIAAHDPAWGWVREVAPVIDLEGRTAYEFLRWAAREGGWTLAFDDPQTARQADETRLSLDTSRLQFEELLPAVLPTCRLTHRIEGGVLVISRLP